MKAEIQALKSEIGSLKTSAPAQGPSTSPPANQSTGAKVTTPPKDDDEGTPGKWNLLAWVRGAGVHRVITAALKQGIADKGLGNDSDAALEFVRGLKDKNEVDSLLRTEAVTGGLRDLLYSEIVILPNS